jgi:hypothetical protein
MTGLSLSVLVSRASGDKGTRIEREIVARHAAIGVKDAAGFGTGWHAHLGIVSLLFIRSS